jgi:hypothetical protein
MAVRLSAQCTGLALLPNKQKRTPWSESATELYRPSGCRLSARLVPTFAERGCHVVSVTDPYCRILGFLARSRYLFLSCNSSILLTRLSGPRSRTHYLSENLVAQGIEPGPLDLWPGTLTTRPLRWSLYSPATLFFYTWYSFLLEVELTPRPSVAERIR